MRTEEDITELIISVAKSDDRIRAVLLSGSRANPLAPKDIYWDYDVCFYVADVEPFYNKPEWITEKFGKPLIMQMPETMRYPAGDGHFGYLTIFPDGVRIDLSFDFRRYIDDGEPAIILLDKDNGKGFLPAIPAPSDKFWHIKPPDELFYYSCCNNFWWCLNNIGKGIVRDELPYVMNMLNDVVRTELHDMINWYIGTNHGFNLSTGKDFKYIKNYLPSEIYERYIKTYPSGNYSEIWNSIWIMCDLFRDLAIKVAEHFNFEYKQHEEDAMRRYLCTLPDASPPASFFASSAEIRL